MKSVNSIEKIVQDVTLLKEKHSGHRKYLKKYLKYLGQDTIETFGYDFNNLLDNVDELEVQFSLGLRDRYHLARCSLISIMEGLVLKQKLSQYKNNKEKFYLLH